MLSQQKSQQSKSSSGGIESKNTVNYFRVKNLAIFSLFHLYKIDVAEFLACCEFIDKDYSQKVNISTFSEIFCPRWKYTFQVLWKRFSIIFTESRSRLNPNPLTTSSNTASDYKSYKATTTKSNNNNNSAPAKNDNNDCVETTTKERDFMATYTEIISFVFFIVSIEELWSPFWIYWLWFTVNKNKITKPCLIDMIDILWGPEYAKQSKEHRVLLKPIVKYLEPDDFNAKKFQLVDWRCHCGYSIPFNSMRKELMSMIGTKELWKRVIGNINEVIQNPSIVVERLGEKKGKLITSSHRASRAIARSHLSGERRDGWFELRDYIEYLLQFHQVIRADPPEPKGAIGRLVFSVSKKVQFTVETMKNILPSSKHLPVDKKGEIELLRESADGIPDDNSLTKLYRKSLKLSVRRLHDMSSKRREKALEGLERCKEELSFKIDFGDDEKEAGGGNGNDDEDDEDEEDGDGDSNEGEEEEGVSSKNASIKKQPSTVGGKTTQKVEQEKGGQEEGDQEEEEDEEYEEGEEEEDGEYEEEEEEEGEEEEGEGNDEGEEEEGEEEAGDAEVQEIE